MKKVPLFLFCLGLVAGLASRPAFADTMLYSNGPSNYNVGQFYIGTNPDGNGEDRGVVTDSFNLAGNSTITDVSFVVWLEPGTTLESVEWSIGATPYGGTPETVGPTNSFVQYTVINGPETWAIYEESFSVPNLSLNAGTYWLTLQDAAVSSGYDALWNINDGPSEAYGDLFMPLGLEAQTISSESFEIDGIGPPSGPPGTVTPEPSSFLLLGTGLVGVARIIRRRPRV